MNKLIIALVIIIIVALFGAGFFLLQKKSTPSQPNDVTPVVSFPDDSIQSSQSNTQTREAVQAAFKKEISSYDTDNTKLYETAVAGNYALQVWKGDNLGGEALLKYDAVTGRWTVITRGGGSWSVEGLVAAGVPESVAQVLLANVPH